MSLKYFSRRTAIDATTNNPFLTNWNHLLTIPKAWRRRNALYDPKLKSVRTRDRIRCWNIVPGDQIRIRGDDSKTLHEVLSINRLSNRVFVKGAVNSEKENEVRMNKNYHYSRCQLFVGNYEFPTGDGLGKEAVPVFAERISSTKARWSILQGRFAWTRFATKTLPKIPWEEKDIVIPWPKPEKPTLPEPAHYDTPRDVVAKLTYKMPQFHQSLVGPIPRPPSEDDFLTSLYNAGLRRYLPAAPLEIYLTKELSNPHSRGKKMQRWKAHKSIEKARLGEITALELKDLAGRTEREAKADAAFRWREEIKNKKTEQQKMRWKHKVGDPKMVRKAKTKVKREDRQRRKLSDLVLEDEPNQVLPKSR
ncbi:hypothetical protein FA15DRAFT_632108 [Coprinopsis marcescibilis]|uniref:KOW domain-containing protein n=1 Tax=Coprinopsis marcescibilis TaxID=230819 RepID=A0A5C3LB46_COPMA|nr:hypothetical protein FA15DRAFT_632108 [Coprinopsis marcescibilis]